MLSKTERRLAVAAKFGALFLASRTGMFLLPVAAYFTTMYVVLWTNRRLLKTGSPDEAK